MTMSGYAYPEVLSETEWVANNLNNPNIRILEVDYDPVRRDIIDKQQFEALMSRIGATHDTELILYGDFNNWFAAFAFWVFQYYGHKKIKIMNGGRKKWELERREYSKDVPSTSPTRYIANPPEEGIRAYMPDIRRAIEKAEQT